MLAKIFRQKQFKLLRFGIFFLYLIGAKLNAQLPADFEEKLVAGNLGPSIAMAFAPDGRLFISDKTGKIRILKNGAVLTKPFLELPVILEGERGLQGIAFDPNFASNHYLYVFYTYAVGPVNRISRFTAGPLKPDVVEPGSEVVLVDSIATAIWHNGGALHFGRDGMLYASTGDALQPQWAQSLARLEGKILRLDPSSYPNIIPADNPFVGVAGARGEIWALGLRNPFTFGIDPATGMIFFNDVGEASWEEVNLGRSGANYGWPLCEGQCADTSFQKPAYAYNHDEGRAITGGAFYRGSQFPAEYSGDYFFADFTGNWIKRLKVSTNVVTTFATKVNTAPIDIDIGPDGSLYFLTLSSLDPEQFNGEIYKIRYIGQGNRSPAAVASANPTGGIAPLQVSFSGAGSHDPDGDSLTYTWAFGDKSPAQTGVKVSHTYKTNGRYYAKLTVRDGRGGSAISDLLPIIAGNPPVGTIITPATGLLYTAGDEIFYSSGATDAEDGALPASAFSWTIAFHHDAHAHPFLGPINGAKTGSFVIPRIGETAANVFYRIHLTVTDKDGLKHTATRDVLPRTSTFTLVTDPPGLKIHLDDQPKATPLSVVGVRGLTRKLTAPVTQMLNGQIFEFVAWSDQGATTHTFDTPALNTTYLATYAFSRQTAGLALSFDGAADMARIPDNPLLSGGPDKSITVEAWVKPMTVSNSHPIITKFLNTNSKDWGLTIENGGLLVDIENENDNWHYQAGSILPNVWTHVAFTFDHNTDVVRIYVNGVAAGPGAKFSRDMPDTPAWIWIGKHHYYDKNMLAGQLDEIRIWNFAQSGSALRANMNRVLQGTEPGLIGYWRLDEGKGQTALDQTGNANSIQLGATANGEPSDPSWVESGLPFLAAPDLKLVAPNGGENWTTGSTQTIKWSSNGAVANVKLEYSVNNGATWTTIIASTANNGIESWTIPNNVSGQCLVRVSDATDGNPVDVSNSAFTIMLAPTLTLTSPNGGENRTVGTVQTITWKSNGAVKDVKLEYSVNSGATWEAIAASTANDGSQPWKIPNNLSTQCLVRVSEAADGDPFDVSDSTFAITATPPTAPNGLVAATVSKTQIDLNWTDNSSNEDGFKIERKTGATGTYAVFKTVGADITSFSNLGLGANTIYFYRVCAYNAVGNSAYSNEASAFTFMNGPSNLAATAVSSNRINLAWKDNSGNETGFKIERKTSAGAYMEIGTARPNATSFADSSGLRPSTQYFYRVRSHNLANASDYSNEANTATLVDAHPLPSAPGNLTAIAASSSQINLAWADSASDESGFQIERSANASGPFALIATAAANVTVYSNTGLAANTPYFYRVRATNANGNSTYTNVASAATLNSNAENLARQKPVTASSTDTSSTPTRAVDGNAVSFWRSGAVNSSNPIVWLKVELSNSLVAVGRVVVRWNQNYYASKYEIQVSNDDANWTTVYTNNSGAAGSQDVTFAPASARYVRLYLTKNNKSSYRVIEVEIYIGGVAKIAENGSADKEARLTSVPEEIILAQNYPNPFGRSPFSQLSGGHSSTTISYSLPQGAHITLKVVNVTGQEVATLVNGYQDRGIYQVNFNARKNLPSGVYYAVLQAGEVTQVRRMVYTK